MSQKKLYEYDLDELCDWMTKLARNDNYVAEKEKKKKDQEKTADAKRKAAEEDSDSETEGPKSKKSSKKDKKKNKKSRKDHQKEDRVGPSNDTCPCHQGPPHKYSRCFLNANGTNYHPERVILNQGNSGGGSRDYSHSNRDNGKDRGDYRRDDNHGCGRDNRRSHDAHYHKDHGRERSRSHSRSPPRRDSSRGRHDGYFVNDCDDYCYEDRRDYRGSREDERRRVETSIFGRNR